MLHLQKLSMSIDDFIRSTPYISEDGAVTLGSKKTSVFEVEPETGRVIRNYSVSDSSSTMNINKEKNAKNSTPNHNELVKSGSVDTNTAQLRLQIMRTDYTLKSFSPNSEIVSWNMTIAEIGAALLCQEVENPLSGTPFNMKDKLGSGRDIALPLSCQSKAIIFRLRNHTLLGSLRSERLSGGLHEDTMLPMSGSGLMLASQLEGEKLVDVRQDTIMLPAPIQDPMFSLQPKANVHQNEGNKAKPPLPLIENGDSELVDVHDMKIPHDNVFSIFYDWSATLTFTLSVIILMGIVIYHCALVNRGKVSLSEQPGNSSSKASSSKKKKVRKLGKNNGSVDNKENHSSPENEDALAHSDGDDKIWSVHNKLLDFGASARRIGKLLVSNTEIAKGSNGTIVLEGNYEGRPVAVKRLVQAHHDIAFKEIQNLIASDRHPNIIRWYGVEYDQDFVYLSLERCTCSLDDAIQMYSHTFHYPISGEDHATRVTFECNAHLESVKTVMPEINFWKENGYPSSILLKLMR